VAAGSAHNAAIKADGSLWTWGSNTHGQLGDGTRVDRDRPVRIGAGGWVHVAAGAVHSAAIDAEGRLYTWGDNSKGQLGVGVAVAASSTPVEIPQYAVSNRWVGLAAGDFHTVAVTQDGDMWAWGSNEFGQVGNNGAAAIEPLPVLIGGHTCAAFGGVCRKWVVVAAAGDHTLAILYDFDGVALTYPLWAWGRNDVGQVGDGTLDDKPSPVKIRADMGWVSVSAGRTHSFAMTGVGGTELWVWGDNSWGQLGIGSAVPWVQEPVRFDAALWRSVSGGGAHSAAIMPDGTLWAWGLNSSGQLGTGVDLNRNTPGQVGTAATWAAVSAGFSHTVAVHSNGTLWAWGLNDAGQLGDDAAWVEALVEIP
jgi:alpha-tubulin suppressor-like RCC1 family protein